MKYFVPVSDEMLFSGEDLGRYPLVPYHPDLNKAKKPRRGLSREQQRASRKGGRHESV